MSASNTSTPGPGASKEPARIAAERIWRLLNRGERFDAFDDGIAPVDNLGGYAIQAQLEALAAEPVVGWKIAGTAEAGRRHINVDTPLAGRLFRSRVYADGASVSFDGNHMAVAEAEIVLVLAKALPAVESGWSRAQIADAVGEIRLGLELPDSRFHDFTAVGAAGLIADNACARDFVLGPVIDQPGLDAQACAQLATRVLVDQQLCTEGSGSDALGGPLDALVWLVNTLNSMGLGLAPGQYVTTGVTGKPVPIKAGNHVRVEAGAGFSVAVNLT